MSREEYAKIYARIPTKFVFLFIAAFGSGAGWLHFSDSGDDIRAAQQQIHACRVALTEARGLVWQYEGDIAELVAWAETTVATLGPVERMGALRSAPPVFTFARGAISK